MIRLRLNIMIDFMPRDSVYGQVVQQSRGFAFSFHLKLHSKKEFRHINNSILHDLRYISSYQRYSDLLNPGNGSWQAIYNGSS